MMVTDENQRACKWSLDDNEDYSIWETQCGNTFEFTVEGIEENHFKYCPYCSGVIRDQTDQ